jgi:inosose dehydratase
MQKSRRNFIARLGAGLGSVAAASVLPKQIFAEPPPLYPPIDLSYFDRPVTPAPSEIRFGYAAITWNENDEQAIKDISAVGFRGIQLRANLLKEFGNNPKAVADLLNQHHLQFVALSGGGPRGSDYDQEQEITTQIAQAAFLKNAGGLYLQMTDSARPKDRQPTSADFKKLGRLLTEVGKRTSDLGVTMAYHNHMNTLGQAPEELDAVMDAVDARYVKLLLDVAHFTQGGGDPVKAILKYRERLLFLHIKDVESTGEGGPGSYRFVELGRGRVDLPGVFAALKEVKFRGWAIVELDSVPDKSRSAKDCAIISKTYIEKLGMKV